MRKKFEKYNYHQLRFELLSKNFVFNQIKAKVRQLMVIPANGFSSNEEVKKWLNKEIHKRLDKTIEGLEKIKGFKKLPNKFHRIALAHEKIENELFRPIRVIASSLNVNASFVAQSVFYKHPQIPDNLLELFPDIRIICSELTPLTEPGVYIKYSPRTTKGELTRLHKVVKGHNLSFHFPKVMRRKEKGYNPERDKEIYSRIEEEIGENIKKKSEGGSLGEEIGKKDAEKVVEYAIKDTAAADVNENLDENLWQKEEDRTFKNYKTIYYRLAKRFNLPTLIDLSTMQWVLDNFHCIEIHTR